MSARSVGVRRRDPEARVTGSRVTRIAVVLLMLAPTVIMPGALNRFVFAKVATAAAGAAVAAWAPATGRLPPWARWILAVGAVLLLVSAFGPGFTTSLLGRAPRYEGVLVLGVYLASGVAGARLLGPDASAEARTWAVRSLGLAMLAVAGLAVLEAAGLRPLTSTLDRPGSLMGNASDQGVVGVLGFGVLAACALRRPDRWTVAGAVAAGLCVALSGSRGALLGLAAAVVVLVWAVRSPRARAAVLLAAVGVVALAAVVPATGGRVMGGSPLATRTVEGRWGIWAATGRMLHHQPLLGAGPSRFGRRVMAWQEQRWYQRYGAQDRIDSPHNWVLQATSSGGAGLGLLALSGLGLAGLAGVRRVRREVATVGQPLGAGLAAAVAGCATALLVHPTSPGPTCLAAVLGGALVAVALPGRRQTGPRQTARGRGGVDAVGPNLATGVLSAGLAVALGLGAVAEIPLRGALTAVAQGDPVLARERVDRAVLLRPWDVEISAVVGHALVAVASDSADPVGLGVARGMLARARVGLPDDPVVLADLATVEEDSGGYDQAAALIGQALAVEPRNPALVLRRGVLAARSGDLAAAERDFLWVARVVPDSPEPWRNLAILYDLRGDQPAADRARSQATAGSRPT